MYGDGWAMYSFRNCFTNKVKNMKTEKEIQDELKSSDKNDEFGIDHDYTKGYQHALKWVLNIS